MASSGKDPVSRIPKNIFLKMIVSSTNQKTCTSRMLVKIRNLNKVCRIFTPSLKNVRFSDVLWGDRCFLLVQVTSFHKSALADEGIREVEKVLCSPIWGAEPPKL